MTARSGGPRWRLAVVGVVLGIAIAVPIYRALGSRSDAGETEPSLISSVDASSAQVGENRRVAPSGNDEVGGPNEPPGFALPDDAEAAAAPTAMDEATPETVTDETGERAEEPAMPPVVVREAPVATPAKIESKVAEPLPAQVQDEPATETVEPLPAAVVEVEVDRQDSGSSLPLTILTSSPGESQRPDLSDNEANKQSDPSNMDRPEPPAARSIPTSVPDVVTTAPRLVAPPKFTLPNRARRLNRDVLISVRVLVDPSGQVIETVLATDPVGFRLDEAAIAAAKSAVYEPASTGGVPVEAWTKIDFALRKQRKDSQ